MRSLPFIVIFDLYLFIFLSSLLATHMPDGYIEQMLSTIITDVGSISIGLLLMVILDFPNDIFLDNGRKSDDVWKISRMKERFQIKSWGTKGYQLVSKSSASAGKVISLKKFISLSVNVFIDTVKYVTQY